MKNYTHKRKEITAFLLDNLVGNGISKQILFKKAEEKKYNQTAVYRAMQDIKSDEKYDFIKIDKNNVLYYRIMAK